MAEGEKAREKGNYYFNKKDYNQAIIHYDIGMHVVICISKNVILILVSKTKMKILKFR